MAYSPGPVILRKPNAVESVVKTPLYIARDSENKRVIGTCRFCWGMYGRRTVYYEGEQTAFERHVAGHDEAEVEAYRQRTSIRAKAPHLFDPQQSGDVELGDWIAENREDIIAGRKLIGGRGSVDKARKRNRGRS